MSETPPDTPDNELRLDIGSGNHPRPHREGWIHVDLDPKVHQLDVQADACALPYPDGAAVEIWTSHLIEHLPPPRVVPFLAECRRVLHSGAEINIHTPHLVNITKALCTMELAYWSEAMAVLYGTDEFGWHTCIFTANILRRMLEQQGFVDIQDLTNKWDDAHDEAWEEMLGGRQMSLKIRATKP
jgi:predicted SAM-dependent methyltransferase